MSARTRDLIEKQIVSLLAGYEAERRFRGRSNRAGARSDFDAVAGFALRIGGDGEGATAYLKWCSFCTRRVVTSNWRAVERFALTLLDVGELAGVALREALAEAFLPPGVTQQARKDFLKKICARIRKTETTL